MDQTYRKIEVSENFANLRCGDLIEMISKDIQLQAYLDFKLVLIN